MITQNEDVKEESSPSTDVKKVEETTPASSVQETTEQVSQEQGQALQDVDEYGVPWKNRAMELQRKLADTAESLPKMIEETLAKKQAQPQQEYSIAQLEAYALEHPEYRPWVEEQKEVLREKRIEEKLTKKQEEDRKVQQNENARQNAERALLNDPRYSEAFVELPNGQKTWNPNSRLTQLMSQYMNNPRLKGDPEAVLIAAKLARADLLDSTAPQSQQALSSLKRENEKLKSKTMVEGSGVQLQQQVKDTFKEAVSNFKKTGSKEAQKIAVREYLKRTGILK